MSQIGKKLIFPAVLACLGLTACGGGSDEPADTTAPSQTSPTSLGAVDLNKEAQKAVRFDEVVQKVNVTGLPAGVSVTAAVSGQDVNLVVKVDPLKFVFTAEEVEVSFNLDAADAKGNSKSVVEKFLIQDVAPIVLPLPDVTRNDDGGYIPMEPINNICPIGVDQFGRAMVCEIVIPDFPYANGQKISFSVESNSIGGTIDISEPQVIYIQRKIRATNGVKVLKDGFTLNLVNNG